MRIPDFTKTLFGIVKDENGIDMPLIRIDLPVTWFEMDNTGNWEIIEDIEFINQCENGFNERPMNYLKYFKGWLTSENMVNKSWLENWTENAKQAEKEDSQLVVFKVPNNRKDEVVSEIESFLKERYSN